MSQFALVAIGYNRENSMKRLLSSLEKAEYGGDTVDLIISVDNSGRDEVARCASDFVWTYGKKTVVTYPERQGLRKHILHCGDFVDEYEAIAVFEDDVIAAPGFYRYMKEAVAFYKNDGRIAGISLYNHLWNVHIDMPFEPAGSPYDTYFFQFAQSWGQVWMKRQWQAFRDWYISHDEEYEARDDIPDSVSGWPKTSWLKYHIKYCIEKDLYFVYPYHALSTCFSDVGEHVERKTTYLQVPMLQGVKSLYAFPKLSAPDAVKYDAFFERVMFVNIDGIPAKDICFDLYGSRRSYLKRRYILSQRGLPYKILRSYALELKPHEANVLNDIQGSELFLYDSSKEDIAPKTKNSKAFRYYFRLYGKTKTLLRLVMENIKRHLYSE